MFIKKLAILLTFSFAVSAMAESNYSCGGTEPFWGLTIKGNKMSVSAPLGDEAVVEEITSRTSAAGTGEEYVFVAKTQNMSATIVTGECSDGMSDEVFSHHIVYTTGSSDDIGVYYGCCNKITK